MKNILLIIITVITFTNVNAQLPIVDIDNGTNFPNSITGAYYKDVQGFMTPFVGTWIYTNGNTSFELVLTKYTMEYTGKFYMDYVAGEYKYVENGVEIRNTLNNTDNFNRGIWSCSSLVKNTAKPPCNNCPTNERRLGGSISDRVWNTHGSITLKLITLNGQPAIEAFIWGEVFNENHHAMATPTGTITFIKQ